MHVKRLTRKVLVMARLLSLLTKTSYKLYPLCASSNKKTFYFATKKNTVLYRNQSFKTTISMSNKTRNHFTRKEVTELRQVSNEI